MNNNNTLEMVRELVRIVVPLLLLAAYLYLVFTGQIEVNEFVDWAVPVIMGMFGVDAVTRIARAVTSE